MAQFASSAGSSTDADGGTTPVTLTVNRVGGSFGRLIVNWRTVDGTAKGDPSSTCNGTGYDYCAASHTLTWADGEAGTKPYAKVLTRLSWGPGDVASKTVKIPILDDDLPEVPETVGVLLWAPGPFP